MTNLIRLKILLTIISKYNKKNHSIIFIYESDGVVYNSCHAVFIKASPITE